MACSGQERAASRASPSPSAGTSSDTTWAWPSSSRRANRSGAVIAHSVWPWQTEPSTRTFTAALLNVSDVEVVELQVGTGVHPKLQARDVAGLLRREVDDRMADVDRLDVGNGQRVLRREGRECVLASRLLQVGPERPVH